MPLPGRSDAFEHLADAARLGSTEALGTLFEQARAYLLLVANRELGRDLRVKSGASDVVQDVFAEAHQSFATFSGTSQAELTAWLRGILLHQIFALRRQFTETQKRDIRREDSLAVDRELQSLIVSRLGPVDHAEARENIEVIWRALESLSDDERQVIQLRYWENLPYREIGTRMGCSRDTARKRWLRAVRSLQHVLRHAGRRIE